MPNRWLVTIAIAVPVLLAGCTSSRTHGDQVSPHAPEPSAGALPHAPAPSTDTPPHRPSGNPYARLILRDGNEVRASGRVVAIPGRHVRFCVPSPVTESDLFISYCDSGVDVARHAHPGSIMQFALSRPAERQVAMLILATGRPAPVRRALQHDYPHQLCVIHSRYTKADVHAARRALMLDQPDSAADRQVGGVGCDDRAAD